MRVAFSLSWLLPACVTACRSCEKYREECEGDALTLCDFACHCDCRDSSMTVLQSVSLGKSFKRAGNGRSDCGSFDTALTCSREALFTLLEK